jgi:hypothetical protein
LPLENRGIAQIGSVDLVHYHTDMEQ